MILLVIPNKMENSCNTVINSYRLISKVIYIDLVLHMSYLNQKKITILSMLMFSQLAHLVRISCSELSSFSTNSSCELHIFW